MLQLQTVVLPHGANRRPSVLVDHLEQQRRLSADFINELERRLSNASTLENIRRFSNDFKLTATKSRKAFFSSLTSIESAVDDFWIALAKLNLMTKSESATLRQSRFKDVLSLDVVRHWTSTLADLWRLDKRDSFMAFDCMLQLFEICLDTSWQHLNGHFDAFVDTLQQQRRQNMESSTVDFFKKSLIALIDSDNLHNTDYVDMLLMHLASYNVKTGRNVLAEFIASIPYFGGFYLRQHDKRFQELFCYIYANEMRQFDSSTKCCRVEITPHYLTCLHFPPKKVIVSNAPPVKLKRRRLISKDKFECEMSAGGLVSGMKPCLDKDDVWVSYLDSNILGFDKVPNHMVPKLIKESVYVRPKFRRSTSMLRCSIGDSSSSERTKNETDGYQEFLYEKAENDFLSLQTKLDRFAEQNFVVNPLIILKEEHAAFYNGISNGLLWPAFHNLPQYIIEEYRGVEGKRRLAIDWSHYAKVNYHFAIHAARSCRQQDFLWIHDYHLFLVGLILRSLDPTLDCGFFLHIPFGLTEKFINDYPEQGLAILRGLLGFTRVGFQTNKDTTNFLRMLKIHFPDVDIKQTNNNACGSGNLIYSITYESAVTDVGTFPISIKMDNFLTLASDTKIGSAIRESRSKVMQKRRGKLFLSVERFDYTKGIVERMAAIGRYFEKFPERAELDVFYQVAASSRSDVSSYQQYQKTVIRMAEEINASLTARLNLDSRVKVVIIDQANHPQEEVVLLYRAADVIVATPAADGMNLVVKEAVICNPKAVFVLSTGAGAENELHDNELGECYIRVTDIGDAETFADLLHEAAAMNDEEARTRGQRLFDYTKQHDIDHWISSFVDHTWTKNVIKPRTAKNPQELRHVIAEMREMRKRAVGYLLENVHVGTPFTLSLKNLQETFNESRQFFKHHKNEKILHNETVSLSEDIAFLDYVVSRRNLPDLLSVFNSLLPSNQHRMLFTEEFQSLSEFIGKSGTADLVIFRWENVLAVPGSFSFSGMQSIAGGLLLSRFIDRFTTRAVIWTDQSFDALTDQMTSPMDTAIVVASNGTEVFAHNRPSFSVECQGRQILSKLYEQLKLETARCTDVSLFFDEFRLEIVSTEEHGGSFQKFLTDVTELKTKFDPSNKFLVLNAHNSCSVEIRVNDLPTSSAVLDRIVDKFGVKIFENKTRIVIFGCKTSDVQWVQWAKNRGALVKAAFLNSTDSYLDYFYDLHAVEYTCPRALLAAMASHVLKKVTTVL